MDEARALLVRPLFGLCEWCPPSLPSTFAKRVAVCYRGQARLNKSHPHLRVHSPAMCITGVYLFHEGMEHIAFADHLSRQLHTIILMVLHDTLLQSP